MIKFDHIEVHVNNSKKYAFFLKKIFKGGRFKKISENGTYMFISNDNFHIEIKENQNFVKKFKKSDGIGFCMPCLRYSGAYEYLSQISEIEITDKIQNPDGPCYFFKDYEGIEWHIKAYDIQDKYINI
mgnify:FL=1|tara:strand:- start:33 stop:416 length:384 start_codon:yes stop_codon:yes gene_type:complete